MPLFKSLQKSFSPQVKRRDPRASYLMYHQKTDDIVSRKPSADKTSITISQSKRDDQWLLSRLDQLWSNYFGNMNQDNPVFIRFGRYSKYRLGSIRLDRYSKYSYITITGMFKDPNIPTEVVDHTIAHELCHYAHGFSSTKPRLHKYPHHGGVIRKELEDRQLHHLVKAYAVWVKEYRKTL